jgi:hypothetical protein
MKLASSERKSTKFFSEFLLQKWAFEFLFFTNVILACSPNQNQDNRTIFVIGINFLRERTGCICPLLFPRDLNWSCLHHFAGRIHSCSFIVKSDSDLLQHNVITVGDMRTDVCGVHAICMTQDGYKTYLQWRKADRRVFKNQFSIGTVMYARVETDLTLKEKRRVKVSENRVLRRIFGH